MEPNRQINDLLAKINLQATLITEQNLALTLQSERLDQLEKKVNVLEGRLCQANSTQAIASHVNNVLREKLDDQEQYSRRYCIVVEGLTLDDDAKVAISNSLNIHPEVLHNQIDKMHPIGPVKDDRTQSRIIKLK